MTCTVKEILSSPAKWTKGDFARSQGGNAVDGDDPAACSWCLLGAIDKCHSLYVKDHQDPTDKSVDAIRKIKDAIKVVVTDPERLSKYLYAIGVGAFDVEIAAFNDDPITTYEEIKKVLELADV